MLESNAFQMEPFAVFAVVKLENGSFAATTRDAYKGEAGRVGLPGGKLQPGESPHQALRRECAEEGWLIEGIGEEPIHAQRVEGRVVHWFQAETAHRLENYKDMGRISAIEITAEQLLRSGYGNENLPV
jgi:predicted NUDIX family NTP pyrophosphohydrolase